MEALLGLLAAAAAVLILARTLRQRRTRRTAPGGSPASAIPISHFGEIDAHVASQRCSCRGRFELRGEGPLADSEHIRRVRIECRECGRERQIYFDMTPVEHALGEV